MPALHITRLKHSCTLSLTLGTEGFSLIFNEIYLSKETLCHITKAKMIYHRNGGKKCLKTDWC